MTMQTSQAPSRMLRGLRIKFIALNMALAVLVLLIAFTTICVLDYRNSLEEVQASLESAIDRSFDDSQRALAKGQPGNGRVWQDRAPDESSADDAFVPPQIGGRFEREQESVPVASYFVSGSLVTQLMGRSSASVSDDILGDAVLQALEAPQQTGYLSSCDLYYAKATEQDGALVVFASGSATEGWKGLAWGLFGIGLIALAVLFVFNLLFSRWALRPVQKAWRQQQQFVADASHELKTPLTVILANSAILQREGDETVASQAQWIESTKVEAERMQGLVTDMLDLARSDADDASMGAPTQADPVSFSRLVEGEVLAFESVAFDRDIAWNSKIEPELKVRGDARRLQRLVAVLLDNACKYTPSGGDVEVSLGREGNLAVLRVNNVGDPIEPEALTHVFDRFYRVDQARTHHGEGEEPNGYGLGLSIAQQIALAHRGTLEAASNAQDGTTFTFKLPLA